MPKHSIFCLFWMKLVAGTDNFVAGIACFRLSLATSLNISTEAPDHRNLGANSINGKLGNFATYGANMGIK